MCVGVEEEKGLFFSSILGNFQNVIKGKENKFHYVGPN